MKSSLDVNSIPFKMMKIVFQLAVVYTIVSFGEHHAQGDYVVGNIDCYTCREAEDNDDCNRYTTPCPSYTHACETQIDTSAGGEVVINKRCVNIDYCYSEGSTYCHQGRCSYCCSQDLCNKNLTYEKAGIQRGDCLPLKGYKGSKGEPGDPVVPSIKGEKGQPGVPGKTGRTGLSGTRGQKGEPGSAGQPGEDGDPGPPGLPGHDASQLLTGVKGPPGPPGLPGLLGFPGIEGDRGPRGPIGLKGDQGDTPPCSCAGFQPAPPHVAFSGTASDIKRADAEEYKPVRLSKVSLNNGDAYDNDSATFVAPFHGVYLFTFTSRANGQGAAPLVLFHNEVHVAQSGRSSLSATGPFSLGAGHFYITLKSYDEVKLKVKPSGEGLWSEIIRGFSSRSDVTFAGHLVAAL